MYILQYVCFINDIVKAWAEVKYMCSGNLLLKGSSLIFVIRLQFSGGDRILGRGEAKAQYSVTSTKLKPDGRNMRLLSFNNK